MDKQYYRPLGLIQGQQPLDRGEIKTKVGLRQVYC